MTFEGFFNINCFSNTNKNKLNSIKPFKINQSFSFSSNQQKQNRTNGTTIKIQYLNEAEKEIRFK